MSNLVIQDLDQEITLAAEKMTSVKGGRRRSFRSINRRYGRVLGVSIRHPADQRSVYVDGLYWGTGWIS